jgi:hypothetical protein
MFHDRIPPDPNNASAASRKGWLRSLFGADEHPLASPPELFDPPVSEDDADIIGTDELVDLTVLATQLAELIQSARDRLDGAVEMVDRSADDAADYGRALNASALALDAQKLPKTTVQALLDVTRQMIDRTETAEGACARPMASCARCSRTSASRRKPPNAIRSQACPTAARLNRRWSVPSKPHAAPMRPCRSPSATSIISSV